MRFAQDRKLRHATRALRALLLLSTLVLIFSVFVLLLLIQLALTHHGRAIFLCCHFCTYYFLFHWCCYYFGIFLLLFLFFDFLQAQAIVVDEVADDGSKQVGEESRRLESLSLILLSWSCTRALARILNDENSRASKFSMHHEAKREIRGCNLCENLRHVTILALAMKTLRDPKTSCPIGVNFRLP